MYATQLEGGWMDGCQDESFMHSAEVWDAVERKVISTERDNTGNKWDKDRSTSYVKKN